ncbi:MAG: aconitate hydratase, partial [Elusimicrobiaceae bacterium]|nr:aconitate hydratase [Elusimicrobiaceae bacterium]
TKNGAMLDLVNSGARILESACGFCIGNSFSPKSGAVSARTSNRNFEGRSGTKDAQAYLVSPEIAALAAIHGKFISPENAGEKYPEISEPDTFLIDDRMFLNLDKAKKEVDIFRGPNIGNPPSNDKMPEALNGSVMIKVGDKITTDHIMPAGPRLKYRSNIKKYSEFVFENIDKDFWKKCLENKEQGGHNIIVAGDSYGQGSSREHAAMCPMYLGVKAVVVKNLERIHAANLVNFGILPLMFENAEDYDKIEAGDKLEAPTWKEDLKNGKNITLKNTTKGVDILVKYELSDRQKDMVLEGGLLNYTTGK